MKAVPAIRISNLHKRYSDVHAVKDISLEIPQGMFYGLLGPNGAGKSTVIHCITGLASITQGNIKVIGHDVVTDYQAARKLVGLSQQDIHIDPYFTIDEVLIYQAGYFGIPTKKARERAEELLKRFGVWDKKDVIYRKLSGGMKRKVEIAKALVHQPKILILDEPTAGLDVQTRKELWEFIKEQNQENGLTVILTTHYIEEAQALCERIGIIQEGKLIQEQTTSDLLSTFSKKILLATYKKKPLSIKGATRTNNTLRYVLNQDENENEVLKKLIQAGTITNIETRSQNLEEVFLTLTEKQQ
jgi:ABC-2 type transport system ATP-binding protein